MSTEGTSKPKGTNGPQEHDEERLMLRDEKTRLIKKLIVEYIHASKLNDIFRNEFGRNVEIRPFDCVLYLRTDHVYERYPSPLKINIVCGEKLKVPYIFLDIEKDIVGFKYQYNSAYPHKFITKLMLKSIFLDKLSYIGPRKPGSNAPYPYDLNVCHGLQYYSYST